MKSKATLSILIIMLLALSTLAGSGCLGVGDLTVYSDYEEVYPECVAYYGNIQNPYNADDNTGTYAQFPKSSIGELTFQNVYDRITIPTNTRGQLSIRMLAADVTGGSGGAVLLVQVYRDSGTVGHKETLILPDYDGYSHWISTTVAPDFTYFDTDGDGKIKVKISHPSTDANVVNLRAVKFRVDKLATTSTTSTTEDTTTDPITTPTTSTDKGTVYFWSDPYGAAVYVDGTMKGNTAALSWGKLVIELSPGSHTWKMEKSGYSTASGTVSVLSGGTHDVFGALSQVDSGTDDPDPITNPTPDPTIDTNKQPVPVITQTQPSTSTVMYSSADSYDPDGSIVSRSWTVDGTSAGTNTVLTVDASELGPGTHEISLIVRDNEGAQGEARNYLTIEKNTITSTETVTAYTPHQEAPTETTGTTEPVTTSGPVFQIPGFGFIAGLLALCLAIYTHEKKKGPGSGRVIE